MEHNFLLMVLSHQSHRQAPECPMEPKDSQWAGDALLLRIEVDACLYNRELLGIHPSALCLNTRNVKLIWLFGTPELVPGAT